MSELLVLAVGDIGGVWGVAVLVGLLLLAVFGAAKNVEQVRHTKPGNWVIGALLLVGLLVLGAHCDQAAKPPKPNATAGPRK